MGGTHYDHVAACSNKQEGIDGFMWVAALHSIVKGGSSSCVERREPTLLSSVLPYTNTETQT